MKNIYVERGFSVSVGEDDRCFYNCPVCKNGSLNFTALGILRLTRTHSETDAGGDKGMDTGCV